MEPKELRTKRWIENFVNKHLKSSKLPIGPYDKDALYDVFVSHSSSDREFIRKVQLFLYHDKGGIQAHVDWQDQNMQHPTNAKTDLLLK